MANAARSLAGGDLPLPTNRTTLFATATLVDFLVIRMDQHGGETSFYVCQLPLNCGHFCVRSRPCWAAATRFAISGADGA